MLPHIFPAPHLCAYFHVQVCLIDILAAADNVQPAIFQTIIKKPFSLHSISPKRMISLVGVLDGRVMVVIDDDTYQWSVVEKERLFWNSRRNKKIVLPWILV